MSSSVQHAVCLPAAAWQERSRAHAERADALTADHRARRASGTRHAVEDFLFEYYHTRPAQLRRWHPGADVVLEPGPGTPVPHAAWRWYSVDADGAVAFDGEAFVGDRGKTARFIHRLLRATASRPPFTGCFGLHEWAMVYRGERRRHDLPLRLGQAGTDAVLEAQPIRCTHFDAFRFFTPQAAPLNRAQPTRATQVDLEQPGCLHASMDCHKWAGKLGPAVPGDLALDCFELARDVRRLDMQASPYDLSAYGEPAVPIETPEGRARYAARQRELAGRAAGLRAALIGVCEGLLGLTPDAEPVGRASDPRRTVGT
jgi:hypothetical protein